MVQPESSSLIQGQAGPSNRYGTLDDEQEKDKDGEAEQSSEKKGLNRRDCTIVLCVVLVLLVINAVTIGFGLPALAKKRAEFCNLTVPSSASPLKSFTSYAIVTDVDYCSSVGSDIFVLGGSVVDAAIATMFCNGVVHPHATGLGGGAILSIYQQSTQTTTIIDGRETAPMGSEHFPKDRLSTGNLSVAIPGELRAYDEAHRLFGWMPWRRLVQPAIELCTKGFPVSKQLAKALARNQHRIIKDATLRSVFLKNGKRVYVEGEIMYRPDLVETLEMIGNERSSALYRDEIGEKLVDDMIELGGKIRLTDLRGYKVEKRNALRKDLPHARTSLYSPPPPGNGAMLSFMLGVIDKFNYTASNATDVAESLAIFHEIVETFKAGYAVNALLDAEPSRGNKTLLNHIISSEFAEKIRLAIENSTDPATIVRAHDSLQNNRDGSHTIALSWDGDAVAATSSLGGTFGSFLMSPQTGILLNNHMADFGTNSSEPNAIASGKRPMSSMAPAIFVDSNTGVPRLIISGSGGSQVITAEAQVALRSLYFEQDVKQAVDGPRLDCQPTLGKVLYEDFFPGILVEKLSIRGHTMARNIQPSAISAISMNSSGLYANVDFRRGGSISGV